VTATPAGTYPQRTFQVPADAVDLLLVRHGQSQAYVAGTKFALVDGHGDPPLSPLGLQQAELVRARLAPAGIDVIYVTTLCRTAQTAAPLAGALDLEPLVEPDLREVHLGDWEGGLYRQMVADGHPLALEMFARERWDVIPGAENAELFAARVRSAILGLADRHPGQRVAVFTHGGVIGQALAEATGARSFAFAGSDNASVSRVVITPDRWVLRAFNDTSHLASLS
jgi:probable phosphoglycerate mutase